MHNLCYHVFKTHSQVTSGQKHARPRTQIAVTRHVTVLLNYTVSTDSAHVLQLIICVCRPTCICLQHIDSSFFYLYVIQEKHLYFDLPTCFFAAICLDTAYTVNKNKKKNNQSINLHVYILSLQDVPRYRNAKAWATGTAPRAVDIALTTYADVHGFEEIKLLMPFWFKCHENQWPMEIKLKD